MGSASVGAVQGPPRAPCPPGGLQECCPAAGYKGEQHLEMPKLRPAGCADSAQRCVLLVLRSVTARPLHLSFKLSPHQAYLKGPQV